MSKLLPENLMNSVNKVAEAAVVPPAKEIGKTFSDLWFIVFGGISQTADKRRVKYKQGLEEYEKLLKTKINQISDENKIEPNTQITAQALENSKYCVEEPKLREMFANLIASSCDATKFSDIHPAFAEIIKQLSPYEAKVLEFAIQLGTPEIATISIRCTLSDEAFYVVRNRTIFDGHSYFNSPAKKSDDLQFSSSCYDNFERLGLIKIYETIPVVGSSTYEIIKMELDNVFQGLKKEYENCEFIYGHYLITNLAMKFAKCCMKKPDNNKLWETLDNDEIDDK